MEQVRKEIHRSPVQVTQVYKSEFQKPNSLTAELRQEVVTTSYYPKANMSNSLNDKLFTTKDFGIDDQTYKSKEIRVAFLNVPESLDTPEKVQEHLKKFPELCLYRILSNKPILSEEDLRAIEQGFISIGTKAESQVVRYPDSSATPGMLALTKAGKVQYRRVAISTSFKDDEDQRNDNPEDTFLTEDLKAELNNVEVAVPESQTI